MNKSKKIIVFLCLFLLSFSIVTDFKRQETQAIALVDDALLWAFGMLVLGTGVVAIKDIQVPHMGSLVLDNLRSSGVSEEEFLIKSADGVLKGIKIYDKVLNAVNSVASSLPNNPFSLELGEPIPWTSGHLLSSENGILLKAKDSLLNLSAKVILTDRPIFTVAYSSSTSVYTSSQLCFNSVYDTSFNVGLVRNGDTYSIVSTCQHGSKTIVSNIDGNTPLIFGFYKDYLTAGSTNPMLDIPYDNPKIKEGYNPTHTDQNLPYTGEKKGYMPLPTEQTMARDISTEMPLTWEDIKETVTDLPIDNTIPGENTGENEGSLDGALDDIFNPSTTKSLDFSPLYISFSNKFPFCIPFDLARIIGDFKANEQYPIFYVDMSGFDSTKTTEAGFSIDFTKFTVLFGIVRTFILVSFVVFLAIKTRDIIKA